MGNENHQHQHPHHDFYHQNLHIHHKSTFIPMLCSRSSIKNVSLPQCRDHPPGSFSNNPLSPRISFRGQVKKRDNKRAGLPTSQHRLSLTTKSNIISISPIVKYSKLKKFFSAKNLTSTTTATPSSCGSRQQVTRVLNCSRDRGRVAELQTNSDHCDRNFCQDANAGLKNPLRCGLQFKTLQVRTVSGADVPRNRNQRCVRNEHVVPISIENMDPPLPVIKGVRKSEEGISLWKRRSGGAALKSLQLQQIHHPRHHLQLTSV